MTVSNETRAETWTAVPRAAGYQVSDAGGFRSVDRMSRDGRRLRGAPMKTRTTSTVPYPMVTYTLDDGTVVTSTVHTVVLEAFAGPCPDGMEACHENDVPTDNRWPENLRWDTPEGNLADRLRNAPVRICIRCQRNPVTRGGRRCHECVVDIGVQAAALLRDGVKLGVACERLGYPSADGLHTLAVKYGGYGAQPPSWSQRVTAAVAALSGRMGGRHSA